MHGTPLPEKCAILNIFVHKQQQKLQPPVRGCFHFLPIQLVVPLLHCLVYYLLVLSSASKIEMVVGRKCIS